MQLNEPLSAQRAEITTKVAYQGLWVVGVEVEFGVQIDTIH